MRARSWPPPWADLADGVTQVGVDRRIDDGGRGIRTSWRAGKCRRRSSRDRSEKEAAGTAQTTA